MKEGLKSQELAEALERAFRVGRNLPIGTSIEEMSEAVTNAMAKAIHDYVSEAIVVIDTWESTTCPPNSPVQGKAKGELK